MPLFSQKTVFRVAAGLLGIAVVTLSLPAPASAGFFERLFGGLRRAVEPPPRPANNVPFVDPLTSLKNHFDPPPQQRADFRPSKAFCVRSCDGRYFPVQAQPGMTAAESCNAFCPASETRLYSGGSIDYAVASDGSRYASLPNAFVYRKQIVAGCTCNGRNAFGLARLKTDIDPTLRPGDIVATKSGLMAFTGNRNNVADFTPVENYARLSKSTRETLADTKIMPPTPVTQPIAEITSSIAPVSSNERDIGNRRPQITR